MAYNKQNFTKGQVLEAEHLNHMEEGIANSLTEHQPIKTVNGQSLVGTGNIIISGDGATVATVDNCNIKSVNHRGFYSAPENTIPAYILSKQNGYKYVECDVSFTSDNVAVLLHDATIDRTSDGSGKITEMTYSEALRYDYGSWKSEAYAGTHIPTLEEFLLTCRGLGLHPYIELKPGSYTKEQILAIVGLVKATGMKGNVTYISFTLSYLSYVKEADSNARLGYLIEPITSEALENAATLKTDTNEVFMDTNYGKVTDEIIQMCIDADIPLEVYTVNDPEKIKAMHPYITGLTTDSQSLEKILYDKYSVYTAPEIEPVPATSVTLSASELTFDTMEAQTLTATVEPSDTTDELVWTSSATNVATVVGGVVTPLSVGSATITATAGSVSATCSVTVNSSVTFTVETAMTNAKISNSATSVNGGSAYVANLTGDDGYNVGGGYVTVTMGGEDVTDTYYADGVVNIPSVTGDISISAEAVLEAPAVPEGYELVKTLYSNDLQYGWGNAVTNPRSTPPYINKVVGRVGYYWNDIPLEYGYKYRIDYIAKTTTSNVAAQQFTSKAMEYFDNATPSTTDSTNIQQYIADSGWKTSGFEWALAESHAGFPITNLRLSFRIDSANTAVTEGDIQSITVSRIKA